MQDHDLQGLWHQGDAKAQEFYKRVASQVETWAKQRSQDLLSKLRRFLLIELWASVAIVLVILVAQYREINSQFYAFVVLFVIVLTISFWWYLRVLHKMAVLNSLPTLESVKGRVQILGQFIRHLRTFMYVGIPFGFFAGAFLQHLGQPAKPDEQWWVYYVVMILIGVPVVILILWLFNRLYINRLYTPILRGYEEVLAKLEAPVEEAQLGEESQANDPDIT